MEREPSQFDLQHPSPGEAKRSFEDTYAAWLIGEVPTEGGRILRAYEMLVDLQDQVERRGILSTFVLRAAQAGHSQSIAPIAVPNIGFRDQLGQRPLTAFLFFLESPRPPQP